MKKIISTVLLLLLTLLPGISVYASNPDYARDFLMQYEVPEGWVSYLPGQNTADEMFLQGTTLDTLEKNCKLSAIGLLAASADGSTQMVLYTKSASHNDLTAVDDQKIPKDMRSIYGMGELEDGLTDSKSEIVMINDQKFYVITGYTEIEGEGPAFVNCYTTVNNGKALVFRFMTRGRENSRQSDITAFINSIRLEDKQVLNKFQLLCIGVAAGCFGISFIMKRLIARNAMKKSAAGRKKQ